MMVVVVVVVLALDQFGCHQAEVDEGKVTIPVDLRRWGWSALDLIGISRHFAPLCDSNSNVLALVKLESAIAQDDSPISFGDFLQHVNLFVSGAKRDRSCFVAHFDLGQSHAGAIDTILVHHNSNVADQTRVVKETQTIRMGLLKHHS